MGVISMRKPQPGRKELRLSVLTSCSDRPLSEFICEVAAISKTRTFDLFVLRDTDVWEINEWLRSEQRPLLVSTPPDTLSNNARILAVEQNLSPILEWLCHQFTLAAGVSKPEESPNKIAALATYFPDITSHSGEGPYGGQDRISIPGTEIQGFTPRQVAIRALRNTMRLALRLKERGLIAPACHGRTAAIVEMVCGTVLDRCPCPDCRTDDGQWAVEFEPEATLQRLCEGLKYVVEGVHGSLEGKRDRDWVLALEVEPGPAYALNSADRVEYLFQVIDAVDSSYEQLGLPFTKLLPHVGLNADVAHLRLAEVGLEPFLHRVVHSHICDLPGMHTRDQVVGTWHPVAHINSPYYPLMRQLSALAGAQGGRANGLPFSGAIALELEGSNHISWVHNSLVAMRHLARLATRIP